MKAIDCSSCVARKSDTVVMFGRITAALALLADHRAFSAASDIPRPSFGHLECPENCQDFFTRLEVLLSVQKLVLKALCVLAEKVPATERFNNPQLLPIAS